MIWCKVPYLSKTENPLNNQTECTETDCKPQRSFVDFRHYGERIAKSIIISIISFVVDIKVTIYRRTNGATLIALESLFWSGASRHVSPISFTKEKKVLQNLLKICSECVWLTGNLDPCSIFFRYAHPKWTM